MGLFSLMAKRGSVYYFRQRVPADLVDKFGKEIKISTKAKDPAEGKKLAKALAIEWEKKFKEARGGNTGQARPKVAIASTDESPMSNAPSLTDLLPEWKKLNGPTANSELEWKK